MFHLVYIRKAENLSRAHRRHRLHLILRVFIHFMYEKIAINFGLKLHCHAIKKVLIK